MSERRELSDRAESVYSTRIHPETTYRIETEILHARVENGDSEWRIDDMSHRGIALIGFLTDEATNATAHTRLSAAQARDLGQSLVAAADVMEEKDE